MSKTCQFCKGTRKILLLISEVDCECIHSNNEDIIPIAELKSGEIGFEYPPTNIPYLIRIKNDFIYVDSHNDFIFNQLDEYSFEDDNWPPDMHSISIDISPNVKIIARNVRSLEKAREIIRIHQETRKQRV